MYDILQTTKLKKIVIEKKKTKAKQKKQNLPTIMKKNYKEKRYKKYA